MALTPHETEQIILGSRLICSFINVLLFGILCLQCYLFFQRKEGDSRRPILRYSVCAALLLNVIHVVCDIGDIYKFTVTDYGNTGQLLANSKSAFGTTVILSSVTSNLLVDIWFTWRVWILAGRSIYVLIGLGAGTGLTWLAGFGIVISSYLAPTFKVVTTEKWIIQVYLAFAIATGLAWTILLSISLTRIRRESPAPGARSVMNRVLVYTVNTGFIAVVLLIVSLIFTQQIPQTSLFYSLYIPYSPLYSNALLGSLNAREWYWESRQILSISLPNIATQTRTENITNLPDQDDDRDDISKVAIRDIESQNEIGVATGMTKASL